MKKTVAVIITLIIVFTCAACKNNELVDNGESTTQTTTGTPGAWVTNAQGELMTTGVAYVIPDENNQPMTQVVTDENGSTRYDLVTTIIYDIWTNPGSTPPETVPAGFTLSHKDKSWPTNEFMAKVPVLADSLSDVSCSENEKGELAIISLNDMSYEDFLEYIEKCKAAGFEQTAGNTKFPETERDGGSYYYYSAANGLYLNVVYNTDSAPYRDCDVKLVVSTYDPLG